MEMSFKLINGEPKMRPSHLKLSLAFAVLLALIQIYPGQTSAAQSDVYSNLQRSRDALLSQQQELQRAYDDTRRQMDTLNTKLTRIDSYMRQVNSSLRDVEEAMRHTR